jgi:thiol-disulfide isomerase/thioredoxin
MAHVEGTSAETGGLKRAARIRSRKRTLALAASVAVVLAVGAVTVNHFTTRGSTAAVNGNIIEYRAGDMPLAHDYTGTSLTGTPISLSSYRGKVLVLNFWGSWCGPCNAEAPTLEVAYQQYHPQGVDFLGDDLDDTVTNALSFDREYGISYPSINDSADSVVQQFSQAALVNDPPTTAVISKDGHVVGMILGTASTSDLATLIHQAQTA